jgi:hypothetical protein
MFEASLASIRATLMTDVAAAFEGDPAARSEDESLLAYPGLVAVAIQRVAHALHTAGVPLLPHADGVGPRADGYRHPSGGVDRRVLLHRSRYGRRDRRCLRDQANA